MTWEELEKGIQELKDQNLVTARLLELHERQSNARWEQINALVQRHEERLGNLEERRGNVEERQDSLEAAMRALFEHMDQFIRGLQSDGRKGPGSEES